MRWEIYYVSLHPPCAVFRYARRSKIIDSELVAYIIFEAVARRFAAVKIYEQTYM